MKMSGEVIKESDRWAKDAVGSISTRDLIN
jgi:hypothetical protein